MRLPLCCLRKCRRGAAELATAPPQTPIAIVQNGKNGEGRHRRYRPIGRIVQNDENVYRKVASFNARY
jgi:hypothetical protein